MGASGRGEGRKSHERSLIAAFTPITKMKSSSPSFVDAILRVARQSRFTWHGSLLGIMSAIDRSVTQRRYAARRNRRGRSPSPPAPSEQLPPDRFASHRPPPPALPYPPPRPPPHTSATTTLP